MQPSLTGYYQHAQEHHDQLLQAIPAAAKALQVLVMRFEHMYMLTRFITILIRRDYKVPLQLINMDVRNVKCPL